MFLGFCIFLEEEGTNIFLGFCVGFVFLWFLGLGKHKKGKPAERRKHIFVVFYFLDFFGAFVFYKMREMICIVIPKFGSSMHDAKARVH